MLFTNRKKLGLLLHAHQLNAISFKWKIMQGFQGCYHMPQVRHAHLGNLVLNPLRHKIKSIYETVHFNNRIWLWNVTGRDLNENNIPGMMARYLTTLHVHWLRCDISFLIQFRQCNTCLWLLLFQEEISLWIIHQIMGSMTFISIIALLCNNHFPGTGTYPISRKW